MTNPDANTFENRKEKFKLIQDQLSPDPRSEDNAGRLLEYIQNGAIPHRGTEPEKEYDRGRLHTNYFLKIFFTVGNEIIDDNLSKTEVQNKLTETKNASTPSHLPSDGSKGQWRTANRHKQKAYEWFLCEWGDK